MLNDDARALLAPLDALNVEAVVDLAEAHTFQVVQNIHGVFADDLIGPRPSVDSVEGVVLQYPVIFQQQAGVVEAAVVTALALLLALLLNAVGRSLDTCGDSLFNGYVQHAHANDGDLTGCDAGALSAVHR